MGLAIFLTVIGIYSAFAVYRTIRTEVKELKSPTPRQLYIQALEPIHLSDAKEIIEYFQSIKRSVFELFPSDTDGKVVGKVVALRQLTAPITNEFCVFYQAEIQAKIDSKWVTIYESESAHDFLVVENANCALVKGDAPKGYLQNDLHFEFEEIGRLEENAVKKIQKILIKYEKAHGILLEWNWIRFREGVLMDGDLVAVSGIGIWQEAQRGIIKRKDFSKTLTFESINQNPVYLCDFPEAFGENEEILA